MFAELPNLPPILDAGPNAPDTFTPDVGQQVDAAGKVTYDFQGHVHGGSFDLDLSGGAVPNPGRDVRWINTADGLVYAAIDADRDNTPNVFLNLKATQASPGFAQTAVAAQIQPDYLNTGITQQRRLVQVHNNTAVLNDGTGDSDNVGIRFGLESGHRIQFYWTGNLQLYVDNVFVGNLI